MLLYPHSLILVDIYFVFVSTLRQNFVPPWWIEIGNDLFSCDTRMNKMEQYPAIFFSMFSTQTLSAWNSKCAKWKMRGVPNG